MELIQTVKLDRKEIDVALEDYLAKQGYQANQISFRFSENHVSNTKTVSGVEIIVTKSSTADAIANG